MIKNLAYPFSYGDELTPEMAPNNRRSIYFYSIFFLIQILASEKNNKSYLSSPTNSKTEIIRIVPYGGDLGKSGTGPRGKGEAAKNITKNGSIFAEAFTPKYEYRSGPKKTHYLAKVLLN